MTQTITSALISVFDKTGLEPLVTQLHQQGALLYSTGGTETFIKNLGIPVIPVEDVTSYPSILGGRVKTLHPKVFGGILNRQNNSEDQSQMQEYQIPQIDLVVVDLYPFEQTVASGACEEDIIEKIDIGGISLIRAGAKNFEDTVIISSSTQYPELVAMLQRSGGTTLAERTRFAAQAFQVTSHYDSAIFNYFASKTEVEALKISQPHSQTLRYGENPHQKGYFYGNLSEVFTQIQGKELSYNNLLDVDAAVNLITEFAHDVPTFAILKHNNACGIASRITIAQAYTDALAGDPTSAFGGVLISNAPISIEAAQLMHSLFFEVLLAPAFEEGVLELLSEKKNRIILQLHELKLPNQTVRTCLNGYLVQDKDTHTDLLADLTTVTETQPTTTEIADLLFASKIGKHTKSNTIVFAKNQQLIASGTGQTSRVDALKQAIEKAQSFGFDLSGAVMASDAFFPFPDCVAIAHNVGITAVIQPGGSVKDQLSIDYCNEHAIGMVFTGIRHFKH